MNSGFKTISLQVAARCRDILLHPKKTWTDIASEPGGVTEAIVPYATIMGLIPSIMMLTAGAGMGFLISKMSGRSGSGSLLFMLRMAVISYFCVLFFPIVIGKIMDLIAPLFGARKSWALSCRVLVFAMTPVYVASLLGIVPLVGVLLSLLAFPWALVLLYWGVGRVLEIRGGRQLLFTLTTVIVYLMIGSLTMSALIFFPGHPATINALPVASSKYSDETSQRLALSKVEAGQGTEADIEWAADFTLKQLVAAGRVKPGGEAEVKAGVIQTFREMQPATKTIQKKVGSL